MDKITNKTLNQLRYASSWGAKEDFKAYVKEHKLQNFLAKPYTFQRWQIFLFLFFLSAILTLVYLL